MLNNVIHVLNQHYNAFNTALYFAQMTDHPTPSDTRAWSQILLSTITGIKGRGRAKGSDLMDGSDVKGANSWGAIDRPRFNGVIKSGTSSNLSDDLMFLDETPFLFFVLWDLNIYGHARCRVWLVRPKLDKLFRNLAERWYKLDKRSSNFQLHPPIGMDRNTLTNSIKSLNYPLLLSASRKETLGYTLDFFDENVLKVGFCY